MQTEGNVAYGNSATFGVTRGLIEVGPPSLLITLDISPLLPNATVIIWWNRIPGFLGTSIALLSTTWGWIKTL